MPLWRVLKPSQKEGASTYEVTIIGIDSAKRVFQLHGARSDGLIAFRKKLSRGQLLAFVAQQPKCLIDMEACATAHGWGPEFEKLGHDVRLIPPVYVKPFVKHQKNDVADAEAIVEAALRPTMFYPADDACIAEGALRGSEDKRSATRIP